MSIKNAISNYLLLKIQQGDFLVGDKLPSEQALAIKFNCNRHTIRSALLPLLNTDVIKSIPGKGNVLNYSLMEMYSNKTWLHANNYNIKKISYTLLPISMLKHYDEDKPCFQETYYSNSKLIAQAYVILDNKLIKEENYRSLFKLFSFYGIVIKKVEINLEVIRNQGRFPEIKEEILIKNKLLFYSNEIKTQAICTLIINPKFFSSKYFSKIF